LYWPTLIKDAEEFAGTCDVCQKIKADHRKHMRALRPAHIPPDPSTPSHLISSRVCLSLGKPSSMRCWSL
ncbi:hypothetical protein PLICRDRAFT_110019, partial [Plicaturopsis crispa FD-325 SS-3]